MFLPPVLAPSAGALVSGFLCSHYSVAHSSTTHFCSPSQARPWHMPLLAAPRQPSLPVIEARSARSRRRITAKTAAMASNLYLGIDV